MSGTPVLNLAQLRDWIQLRFPAPVSQEPSVTAARTRPGMLQLLSALQKQTAEHAEMGREFPTSGVGALDTQRRDLSAQEAEVTQRLSAVIADHEDAKLNEEAAHVLAGKLVRLLMTLTAEDLLAVHAQVHAHRQPIDPCRFKQLCPARSEPEIAALVKHARQQRRDFGSVMSPQEVQQCAAQLFSPNG